MLTNQKAKELAEIYTQKIQLELGDDLLLVLLFGSTVEGKPFPKDVDIFVSGRSGKKPGLDIEHVNVAYRSLDQIKELIQGRGQGDPGFVRRRFMGHTEILYEVGDYYLQINRAFASGNTDYIK